MKDRCMRCKKIIETLGNYYVSHCAKCMPLVKKKMEETRDKIDSLRQEAHNFMYGKETNDN